MNSVNILGEVFSFQNGQDYSTIQEKVDLIIVTAKMSSYSVKLSNNVTPKKHVLKDFNNYLYALYFKSIENMFNLNVWVNESNEISSMNFRVFKGADINRISYWKHYHGVELLNDFFEDIYGRL